MDSTVAELFLGYSARTLSEMTKCIQSCLAKLNDEQVWQRQAAHENTIGNLILHLCGNMRQWIMHGVGNEPDVRTRDAEFSTNGGLTGKQLFELFASTAAAAKNVIETLPHERLLDRIDPQRSGEMFVLEAIYKVVGHVQQHTGQIIFLTKQMTASDLDLSIPRPR